MTNCRGLHSEGLKSETSRMPIPSNGGGGNWTGQIASGIDGCNESPVALVASGGPAMAMAGHGMRIPSTCDAAGPSSSSGMHTRRRVTHADLYVAHAWARRGYVGFGTPSRQRPCFCGRAGMQPRRLSSKRSRNRPGTGASTAANKSQSVSSGEVVCDRAGVESSSMDAQARDVAAFRPE